MRNAHTGGPLVRSRADGGALIGALPSGMAQSIFPNFALAALTLIVLAATTATAPVALAAGAVIGTISEESTPDGHKMPHVLRTLTEKNPARTPLWVAYNKLLSNEPAKAEKVEWEEDDIIPRQTRVNGAEAAGGANAAVTFTVDEPIYKTDDTLLLGDNATAPDAVLRVVSVAGNDVTVVRVDGGSLTTWGTVPALADNERISRIHTSKKEGFDLGAPRTTMPVKMYNYVEDIEGVIEITGRREMTRNYTSRGDWDRSKVRNEDDFKLGQEYRLFFGAREKKVIGGENRTFTGGITRFIDKNLVYSRASFDEGDLLDIFRQVFSGNNGSAMRYLHVDPYFAIALATIPLDKVRRTQIESKTLKMGVTRIDVDGFGSLAVVPEQMFAMAGKDNYAVALDYANLGKHTMRPMKGHVIDRLKTVGTDKKVVQLLCADSLSVHNADSHAVIELTP